MAERHFQLESWLTMAEDRLERLRAQIAEQVELVARLICENKSAVAAEAGLHRLERKLAAEEQALGHRRPAVSENEPPFPRVPFRRNS